MESEFGYFFLGRVFGGWRFRLGVLVRLRIRVLEVCVFFKSTFFVRYLWRGVRLFLNYNFLENIEEGGWSGEGNRSRVRMLLAGTM